MGLKERDYVKKILELMEDKNYVPLRSKEIALELGIEKKKYNIFRATLENLYERKKIKRYKKIRWKKTELEKPKVEKTLEGVIDIAISGHGFFIPDEKEYDDLFISPENLGYAFDGDKVKVQVFGGNNRDRRPYGKVVEIIERMQKRLVAVLISENKARAEDPRYQFEFIINFSEDVLKKSASQIAKDVRRKKYDDNNQINENTEKNKKNKKNKKKIKLPSKGTKLLIEVKQWADKNMQGKADVIEILGPGGDPDTETAAILAAHEAPGDFPEEVLLETRKLKRELDDNDIKSRLDFTKEITCTIDPVDAKDFDDALSISVNPEGGWKVGIHIADVAHYVQIDAELDKEARERGNSIYLPERVIPMLPEELSNDICSLRPGEVRPVKTVFINYDAQGKRLDYSIHKALIKSAYRFSYQEVKELLTDEKLQEEFNDKKLLKTLTELNNLATILRNNRIDNDSIELNIPEYRVLIDEDGHAAELIKTETNFAHNLVEEFMLAANRVLAEWSAQNGLPVLHRVHPPPSEDKIASLAEFLNACGYSFKLPFKRKKLKDVINKAKGKPEEKAINMMVLKSFQQAVYAPEADIGHFALNFAKYQHFTSPIRRYADLFLHQMLDKAFISEKHKLPKKIRKAILADKKQLDALGTHVSQRERRAMIIEEEIKKFRRLELLALKKQKEFKAIVTGIKKFGIFVELEDFFVESLLPKFMLEKKGYTTREDMPPNRQKNTKNIKKNKPITPGFYIGQEIKVRVKQINLTERMCELEFVEIIE